MVEVAATVGGSGCVETEIGRCFIFFLVLLFLFELRYSADERVFAMPNDSPKWFHHNSGMEWIRYTQVYSN